MNHRDISVQGLIQCLRSVWQVSNGQKSGSIFSEFYIDRYGKVGFWSGKTELRHYFVEDTSSSPFRTYSLSKHKLKLHCWPRLQMLHMLITRNKNVPVISTFIIERVHVNRKWEWKTKWRAIGMLDYLTFGSALRGMLSFTTVDVICWLVLMKFFPPGLETSAKSKEK